MKIILGMLVCACLFGMSVNAQSLYHLSGTVKSEKNQYMADAAVLLIPGWQGTMVDKNGFFSIGKLSKGEYILSISYLGYKTFTDTIFVDRDIRLNIALEPSLQTLNEVVVTDNYADMRKKQESLNLEVVNDDYLVQNLGGSLMQSLKRLPGVSSIDIGSGQSKPVIRGLSFNRVVVVENGIKHEGQQWGADHGLEIDQFAIDRVEVIKGPASLMFGSDAIGGVIDLKQTEVPATNSFGCTVALTGKSNNDLIGSSVYLFARKQKLYVTARITLLDYADYKVPTDSIDIYSYKASLCENRLRNTAGYEHDFHVSVGYKQNCYSGRLYFSYVDAKSGFFANTHGLEPRLVDTELQDKSNRDILDPYQKVNHLKIINKNEWNYDNYNISSEIGFQRNFRQEISQYVQHGYMPAVFPDTLPFASNLEREFDKSVFSGNVKIKYSALNKVILYGGLNADFQDNKINGRGFIIPAFRQFTAGIFVYAKHKITTRSFIHAGTRYNYGKISTDRYCDWFSSPVIEDTDTTMEYLQRAPELNRIFSSMIWSVGYSLDKKNISVKLNIGKSFRMPIAKELAANGVNYHHFSYEVGDSTLSAEVSYQFDAGLEYTTERFAIGITPFVNYFSNYIYLNPSSEHDRLYGNGNQKFYYTESEVFRYGSEINAHYCLTDYLQIGCIGDYVYPEQLTGAKKGFTIPFSPPASLLFNFKFEPKKTLELKNAYVSIDYKLTARQDNIVPPEKKTNGYSVINLRLGSEVSIKTVHPRISVQIQNLLNKKYFNHTSYYRLINVPEPGRNFVVNITVPFSGTIN